MGIPLRSASLRVRTMLAILAMLAVLVGTLTVLSEAIIQRSFDAIEVDTVEDRVEQAVNALDNAIAGIDRVTRDYATWDDTYRFAVDGNETYRIDNLSDLTFINNNLSYIAVLDPTGAIIAEQAFDLSTQTERTVPPELQSFDGENTRFLQHSAGAVPAAGLIMLAEGPLLIAAQPILTSQGEGPPTGTLLMGRFLDEREVARLSEITRLQISVIQGNDPTMPPDLRRAIEALGAGSTIAAIPLSAERISGVTHIPDLRGRPGIVLQVELPRDVLLLAQNTARQYTLALLGAGLVFSLLAALILERAVLARLFGLSKQVAAIDAAQPETDIHVRGADEISQLGTTINAMVQRLAQTQQQLSAGEQRYRQLIELSPDAVIVHDGAQIRYTNPAGAALLGGGVPALYIGRPIAPVIQAITPAPDGTPVHVEQIVTPPNGAPIEAELIVLPFNDRDAAAVQVIVRNITARKQIEKTLQAAKEAADAANRAKSLFLATMSHELRTPLTAIIGYAELLDRELAPNATADTLRDLGRIRTAGTHLLALINDVLDLSKIEAGQMQVYPAAVEVSELLDTVADSVGPLAERNGNQLRFVTADPKLELETDATHLCQILINLVGNGCKFTHQGSVTVTVDIAPPTAPDAVEQVRFQVADTGIGMRPDQVAQLFHDFVQVDASSTRKYGGTGLGLALSRRLAHLLGGTITVESAVGVGSTFTLTVPRILVPALPAKHDLPDLIDTEDPAGAPNALLQSDAATETRIILVIDDDSAVRDLLPRALANPGWHFETAATGREGLELATALIPDLIMLDLLLPELDGWTVLRLLRENPETRTIPVLILSIDQHAEQGLILGAAGIMQKPVDLKQLANETATLLRRRSTGSHVLIVEDQAEIRGYLRRTLESDGWLVDEAADGATALALFAQRPIDLAIVDLMLPEIDGITLISAIRKRPGGDVLPILVVTAKDLSPSEHAQLNRSMAQVLQKGSFRSDDLVRTARAMLKAHGLTSQVQE